VSAAFVDKCLEGIIEKAFLILVFATKELRTE